MYISHTGIVAKQVRTEFREAVAQSEERMIGKIEESETRMTGKMTQAITESEERMTGKIRESEIGTARFVGQAFNDFAETQDQRGLFSAVFGCFMIRARR